MLDMRIRESTEADLNDVLFVEREAFHSHKEADLTRDMLSDPTAEPRLSLLAYINNQPAGHILFTSAHIDAAPNSVVSNLAPLAVVPRFQKQGVGGNLIAEGLKLLTKAKVDLVFVLGHPTYYPRYGFAPAGKQGFEAPFPILEKDADAWMVQELKPGVIGSVKGRVVCCDALMKEEHWRE